MVGCHHTNYASWNDGVGPRGLLSTNITHLTLHLDFSTGAMILFRCDVTIGGNTTITGNTATGVGGMYDFRQTSQFGSAFRWTFS